MSLRVLLADESDTIKKVFQLALQDMNVEVKTVQSGLDVVNVAESFQPQLIFADVLLQKKNGYDMCLEIKQNSNLSNIPVILMWSSFMELDQEQFKKSRADEQLEKPFDADLLRGLVKKFVPHAAGNPVSSFLKFPKNMGKAGKSAPPPVVEKQRKEETSEFNLNSIFSDLPKATEPKPASENLGLGDADATPPPSFSDFQEQEDAFVMPPLESAPSVEFSQFRIEPQADNLEKFESLNLTEESPSFSDNISMAPLTQDEVLMNEIDHIQPTNLDNVFQVEQYSAPQNRTQTSAKSTVSTTGLNDNEIEAIVRAHTEEFIKNQLKDSLLHIVEKIVREELNKVLEEEVRLKQELLDDNP